MKIVLEGGECGSGKMLRIQMNLKPLLAQQYSTVQYISAPVYLHNKGQSIYNILAALR